MKKLLATCALCAVIAAPASAQEFKPYIGADFVHLNVDYNSDYGLGGFSLDGDSILEDSFNGFNVHVGSRFHKSFGLELGYTYLAEEDKNIETGQTVGAGVVATQDFTTETQIDGFTLDALGYLPVSDQVELIGSVGVSWLNAEVDVPGFGSEDEDEIGFRGGAGAQFNLTEQVSLRGMARYQSMDFDDVADDAWLLTAGLNYSF